MGELRQTISEENGGLFDVNITLRTSKSNTEGAYETSIIATDAFVNYEVRWDSFQCVFRGEPDDACQADSPLADQLDDITSVGFSIGFKHGSFSVEVKSMSAWK